MADEALNLQPVIDWLIDGARPAADPKEALMLLCQRLLENGLSLCRVAVFVRTLHPNVPGRAFYWREGSAIEEDEADHAPRGGLHRRRNRSPAPPQACARPPHRGLRPCPQGAQHPRRLPRPAGGREGARRPHPARRRRGHQRGDLVLRPARLHAARRLHEPAGLPAPAQRLFECVLGPVLERQGEVLRFIGDAALAIFPVGERPAEACAKALAAARDAPARMDKLNKNRQRPLRCGIGLHLGELTYGNIGTPTRIESVQGLGGGSSSFGAGGARAAGRVEIARQPHAARRRG